ncbi:MAG: hypothetical protein ACYTFI_12745 [Planctomycetota bacterium]
MFFSCLIGFVLLIGAYGGYCHFTGREPIRGADGQVLSTTGAVLALLAVGAMAACGVAIWALLLRKFIGRSPAVEPDPEQRRGPDPRIESDAATPSEGESRETE